MYYANGSYYDPEVGLYVDASPIDTVIDNALTTRSLDRNGLMCNNVLELASNPYNISNTQGLSADPTYEAHFYWWQKAAKTISDYWNSVSIGAKVFLGVSLIGFSIALAIATQGASLPLEAMLLGGETMVITTVAQTALIDISVGIGFAVAGWAVTSALTGTWNTGTLSNSIADAIFFTGVFMFISASVNAIKYLARSRPVSTAELTKNTHELTNAELIAFGEPGKNQGFRQIMGTHEDAMDFVISQTKSLTEYAPGKLVGYNSRGIEFRIYARFKVSYTSIRITGVQGLKGIKFMWP